VAEASLREHAPVTPLLYRGFSQHGRPHWLQLCKVVLRWLVEARYASQTT
jgi:hypothetical protein